MNEVYCSSDVRQRARGRAGRHLCGGVQQGSLLLIILHKSAVSAARERERGGDKKKFAAAFKSAVFQMAVSHCH